MIEIELHSRKYPGLFALVDDQDFELVSQYRWFPHKNKINRTFYAQANSRVDGKRIHITMHRLIMGFPDCDVDHENRNGLDNQRHNLREANRSQNQGNVAKQDGKYSSRFKGVWWNRSNGKWQAGIRAPGKNKHLGMFTDEVAAARAYDAAAVETFGEFALTNFPVETTTPVVVNVFVQVELPIAA